MSEETHGTKMTTGTTEMHSSKSKFDDDWRRDLEEETRLTPEEEKKAEADRREEEEMLRTLAECEREIDEAEDTRLMRLLDEEYEQGREERFKSRMIDALEPFGLD